MMGRPYYGLSGTTLNIAIGVMAGIDFLLFGYDQGVMGGLLNDETFEKQFPGIDTSRNTSVRTAVVQGATVGAYTLGCFFGAIATIWLGNVLGRKKTIFLGSSIMTVGAIIQASSYSLAQLIVGRVITGFGNGMNTSTIPTWLSETSKANRRGMLVSIEGAMITGGIMISYWMDFGFSFIKTSDVNWRFPIAFQIVFCLLILAFIMGLPESPRWLILKGKDDEALKVLSVLARREPDDPFVQTEFNAIRDTVLIESKGAFRDLFTMNEDRHFHRVCLAVVSQIFQQISFINLITYYAPTIYKNSVHLQGILPDLIASCNGTEYFLASWVAVFVIEKFGRRKLMLFGSAGQAMSMVVLAISTSFVGNSSAGIAASVFLFVFNTFFAIGWLGMTWLYPAEIVPLRIRAPANAVSTSANWLFNFIIVILSPVLFSAIQYKTYIIAACVNAAIIPCVYLFFPETAGRSLEEMDSIFHKTTNIFNVVTIARNEPHWYGKHGELVVNYEDTAEGRRHSSVTGKGLRQRSIRASDDEEKSFDKAEHLEKVDGGDSSS